jgi:hypothetical protein
MRERSLKSTYETKSLLTLPTRGDWSYREHREIDRIRVACVEHPNLQLEFGQTDEGDPWCIVYDHARDRVISHIARIDRCYTVVRLRQSRLDRATNVTREPAGSVVR